MSYRPGAKFTKHLTIILRQKSYDHFLGVLRHSKLYNSNIIQQWKTSLYRFIRPLI